MKDDIRDMPLAQRLPAEIITRIHEDIGAASMCWENPKGAGIFKCNEALTIALNLCQFIADKLEEAKQNS